MEIGKELENIAPKYKQILQNTEPYLLTFPGNLPRFNLSPFGYKIPEKNIFSCINSKNAKFFDLLQVLDKLSFGPVGMPMEKWIFFDCGEMVGGIFGFGIRAEQVGREIFKHYELDLSYKGLIPISMYIAIPMAMGTAWFGHNLCSANSFLGDKFSFSGLALLTKVFGVKTYGITDHYGATQWESGALNIHLQMADMEVRSSYTPAHSFSKTMTYKSTYTDEVLLKALSGNPRKATSWDQLVDVSCDNFFIDLQKEIEEGKDYTVVGRPIYENGTTFLPLKHS